MRRDPRGRGALRRRDGDPGGSRTAPPSAATARTTTCACTCGNVLAESMHAAQMTKKVRVRCGRCSDRQRRRHRRLVPCVTAEGGSADVLLIGLLAVRRLRAAVGRRVGGVARRAVDALLGRGLLRARRAPESPRSRAPDPARRALRDHRARRPRPRSAPTRPCLCRPCRPSYPASRVMACHNLDDGRGDSAQAPRGRRSARGRRAPPCCTRRSRTRTRGSRQRLARRPRRRRGPRRPRAAATPTSATAAPSTTPPTASTRTRSCATSTGARRRRLPNGRVLREWELDALDKEIEVAPGVQVRRLDLQRPHPRPDAALPRGRAAADHVRQRLGAPAHDPLPRHPPGRDGRRARASARARSRRAARPSTSSTRCPPACTSTTATCARWPSTSPRASTARSSSTRRTAARTPTSW